MGSLTTPQVSPTLQSKSASPFSLVHSLFLSIAIITGSDFVSFVWFSLYRLTLPKVNNGRTYPHCLQYPWCLEQSR